MKGATEQSTSGHYYESLNSDFHLQMKFIPTQSIKFIDRNSITAVVFDYMTDYLFVYDHMSAGLCAWRQSYCTDLFHIS